MARVRVGDALNAQAFAALTASPGARAFCDQQRAAGHEHNDAPRRLANRPVGIFRCIPISAWQVSVQMD